MRNCDYRLHHWGSDSAGAPTVILLHGFLDCGASWQLTVDELLPALNQKSGEAWSIIAPDWRGFGDSGWNEQHYWFPDYLADLDALLRSRPNDAGRPVVVGHSMGANVTGLYAGTRPESIAAIALLEGFGLPDSEPDTAPQRMEKWLDELTAPPEHRTYPSVAALAASMQKHNMRLTDDVAQRIAKDWSKPIDVAAPDGPVTLKADPRHRMRGPILYRRAEALAFWQKITAPALWLEGAETNFTTFYEPSDLAERQSAIRGLQKQQIADAGHMLHHEQPAAVAAALADFILQPAVLQRMRSSDDAAPQ